MRPSSPQRLVATPPRSLHPIEREHVSSVVLMLMGAVAFGLLVLQRIAVWVHEYGGSEISRYAQMNRAQAIGEIAVSSLALIGIVQFAIRKRRDTSIFKTRHNASTTIGWRDRRDLIVVRAGTFGVVLAALFVVLVCWSSHLSGTAMSLSSSATVVPMYLLMGYALIVGVMLAAISTVGLRVLHEIREALRIIFSRIVRFFVPTWLPSFASALVHPTYYVVTRALRGPPSLISV